VDLEKVKVKERVKDQVQLAVRVLAQDQPTVVTLQLAEKAVDQAKLMAAVQPQAKAVAQDKLKVV